MCVLVSIYAVLILFYFLIVYLVFESLIVKQLNVLLFVLHQAPDDISLSINLQNLHSDASNTITRALSSAERNIKVPEVTF